MNEKIREILNQISALEDELRATLREQQSRFMFQIEGKRVEFEQSIEEAHRKLKTSLFRWFRTIRPLNLITAPIIYSMIVPLALLDLCVSFYQATCFPIYGIPKVKRADYIVFDHQHLAYLNIIEKFHCLYCSYGNGLIAYAREIIGRTEQYFCPIKHAHKVLGTHPRYPQFLEYGEAEDFEKRLEEYRQALAKEARAAPKMED
ncbi:MAG: hypothetical protein HY849_00670 [Nitrosomonadales bacterium]|nr:hypothetical protein [Nitrosomonadales bacterium]